MDKEKQHPDLQQENAPAELQENTNSEGDKPISGSFIKKIIPSSKKQAKSQNSDPEQKDNFTPAQEGKSAAGKSLFPFSKKSASQKQNECTEEQISTIQTEENAPDSQNVSDTTEIQQLDLKNISPNFQAELENSGEFLPAELLKSELTEAQSQTDSAKNRSSIISTFSSEIHKNLVEFCGGENNYDIYTYQLLSYLNECLENGSVPDWNLITQEVKGVSLLHTTATYRIYLLEHLLADGYIEGFVIDQESEERVKTPLETTGIQITPLGKRYLKSNSKMAKLGSFLGLVPGLESLKNVLSK